MGTKRPGRKRKPSGFSGLPPPIKRAFFYVLSTTTRFHTARADRGRAAQELKWRLLAQSGSKRYGCSPATSGRSSPEALDRFQSVVALSEVTCERPHQGQKRTLRLIRSCCPRRSLDV